MVTLSETSLRWLSLPRRHSLSSGAFSATFGIARKATHRDSAFNGTTVVTLSNFRQTEFQCLRCR